ncbi:MAG TPA: TIGR04283 family arsenosugar biosynthesis glycosyltransferase [Burkholderiales bacterium]|nr:TIGR04283 family arsenosugar biosynthesis glycosyltransferase [Burkholderiales bacterium]
MHLSIVIPTLNEARNIESCLRALAPLRARGVDVVVADGGSDDATAEIARPLCDSVLTAPRGRALQMNAGARAARGDVLLFLHADCVLPAGADELIHAALPASPHVWGRFDVRLSGRRPLLRLVESMMNLRSRITGIATGDQAIFVTRRAFDAVGGFPAIALMEDIAVSAALKRLSAPLCLRARVVVSSRRWERQGVLRTILLMWRLRAAYFLGARPEQLSRIYYRDGN